MAETNNRVEVDPAAIGDGKRCPACLDRAQRVLYLGFPMWLCDCSCLFGFWSWVAIHFQAEDGGWSFMAYEGSYWRALWRWLRGAP